jgi:SAM-dependent methyltransferase
MADPPAALRAALPEGSALPRVEVLDIGCGFGGLLFNIAPLLEPGVLACGFEIRAPPADYVRLQILHARREGRPEVRAFWWGCF